MELTATPFRHCLRKPSINIVFVLGKYLENYRLLNFPHLGMFYGMKARVRFLKREEKKEKGTNITKMHKNIQKTRIF